MAIHEFPGVGVIRVHQTGKQHARKEHPCRLVFGGKGGHVCLRQRQFALQSVVVFQPALRRPVHAAKERARFRPIAAAAAVRQPAMVPCHGKSSKNLQHFHALKGPGCGVVHLGAVFQQTALKTGRAFADIVKLSGQLALRPGAKARGECSAPLGSPQQVFQNGLYAAVLRHMGKIGIFCHRLFFPLSAILHSFTIL